MGVTHTGRSALASFMGATILVLAVEEGRAQQTIYNVPSPDVLEAGKIYLENDWYFRPWKTESDRAGRFFLRSVVGVGSNVELGVNTGAFDLVGAGSPFADLTVKWRPVYHEMGEGKTPGGFGLYLGNHAGVGLRGDVAGGARDLVYGSTFLKIPVLETRIAAGPYFATRQVFGEHARGGLLATFEQPVPGIDGLLLAADWFSGRGGYATGGLIYSRGPFVFYLGYGFANTGRKDDLLTFEVGINLH